MLFVGQSVKIKYVGEPPPEDGHEDLKAWWVRDYNATILSITDKCIVVKDTDASEDWVDCTYTIWLKDKTVNIIPVH